MEPMSEKLRRKVDLISRCDYVSNESLASTRRIKALCDESKLMAGFTIAMLDEQGDKIHNQLDEMTIMQTSIISEASAGLQTSQHGRWCSCLFPWLSFARAAQKYQSEIDTSNLSSNSKNQQLSEPQKAVRNNGITRKRSRSLSAKPVFVDRILDDWREDEMEANLESAHSTIMGLRLMAYDIGAETGRQNRSLAEIIDLSSAHGTLRTASARSSPMLRTRKL